MASSYDPTKKCRVGTMDQAQFNAETVEANATYFWSLIDAWEAKGGELRWGAGGVGLRAAIGGKKVGVCFLAPAYAGKQDRIELSLTILAKQVGQARCDRLKTDLCMAAGSSLTGTSMISIVAPGALSASSRRLLTSALVGLL